MVYVKIYPRLPEEACYIREAVFVEEQGFADEFDAFKLQNSWSSRAPERGVAIPYCYRDYTLFVGDCDASVRTGSQ